MNRLATFFVVISLIFIFSRVCFAAPAGEIKAMSGDVSYRDRNNVPYNTAAVGTALEKGWWVKTGADGWAELLLPDGSKITLANNTEIEITEFTMAKKKKQAVLNLMQGKIKANIIKPVGEKMNYTVKSPSAVIGVRGTEFMMMNQGFANVFFGNEGVAEVSGDSKEKKSLTGDTVVQNTRGYVPTDPVDIKPDTPLATAKQNFNDITAAQPPKDWEISNNLPHIIARWNVNYGHYLADSGKYEQALYVFQIALDLTSAPEIRSDARLERGAVYASFLRNPEAALSEYLLVIEEYPNVPQREFALFQAAMTLKELGFNDQARLRFQQYLKEYPAGKKAGNAETMLNLLNK